MYNPIKRVKEGFRSEERQKKLRPHSSVENLELVAVLSVIPSVVIFLYAFVLSAATYLATVEVAKNNFVLGGAIYFLFNIVPAAIALVVLMADPSTRYQSASALLLYGGLGIWGFYAIKQQKGYSSAVS